MSAWQDGRIVNDLTPDAVITSIAVASGLGSSSARTWMKLPVVDDMARVMAATTLPTLLLGGDPQGASETPGPAGSTRSTSPASAAWSSAAR